MRGQTKQHLGPPAVGDWAWGQQPYLIKVCTATGTSRCVPRDTTAWGVNKPPARRPMTPGSESQVHHSWRRDLGADMTRNGYKWGELQRLAQDRILSVNGPAFVFATPKLWNALPRFIRESTFKSFKGKLKTHFFEKAFCTT